MTTPPIVHEATLRIESSVDTPEDISSVLGIVPSDVGRAKANIENADGSRCVVHSVLWLLDFSSGEGESFEDLLYRVVEFIETRCRDGIERNPDWACDIFFKYSFDSNSINNSITVDTDIMIRLCNLRVDLWIDIME
jgi:hypothetical protein